jgi:hypothetical protein
LPAGEPARVAGGTFVDEVATAGAAARVAALRGIVVRGAIDPAATVPRPAVRGASCGRASEAPGTPPAASPDGDVDTGVGDRVGERADVE